jgi:hypothetical protein
LEVLLQHYGAGFTISRKLQASIEATQLEVGCKGNPLNEDCHTLGWLATEGWVKAVWERALHYRFTIMLDYPMQDPPRERERNLVKIFLENGKMGSELRSINKCRISHQAMYLSCLSTAEGKNLNPIYFIPPQVNKRMSFHQFGHEEPTRQDWASWEAFWRGYCGQFLEFPLPLGDWKNTQAQNMVLVY